MEIILIIIVIILIFIVRGLSKKISFLTRDISAIFWALKSKKVIDIKDLEYGRKVAKGEKMTPLSLKDFMSEE